MWANVGSRSGNGGRIVGLHSGDEFWRVSPDIYPPFKGVMTWHYLWWIEMKCHVVKVCEVDALGCSGMFLVEVHY